MFGKLIRKNHPRITKSGFDYEKEDEDEDDWNWLRSNLPAGQDERNDANMMAALLLCIFAFNFEIVLRSREL